MTSLLLAVIYLAFISLGLPDSLLGAAWPAMQPSLGVPLSYAGLLSMIIALGTIVSSLQSDRLTLRLGTGRVTTISVGMTAAALLGFSLSGSFCQLCLWAIPYGLGAGSVDAALNNYVALHYKSRHMSWLHCMWGVGAAAGPYLMGQALTGGAGWAAGYATVAGLQALLTLLLLCSLPLWQKRPGAAAQARPTQAQATQTTQTTQTQAAQPSQAQAAPAPARTAPAARAQTQAAQTAPASVPATQPQGVQEAEEKRRPLPLAAVVRIRGVREVMLAFFCYCAVEQTCGLWASSFLHLGRGMSAERAAGLAALFFLGITAGRAVSGFLLHQERQREEDVVRRYIVTGILGIPGDRAADLRGAAARGPRLRAHLPLHHPCHAEPFRQGAVAGHHRRRDGRRLHRHDAHAAALRSAGPVDLRGTLPRLPPGDAGAAGCDDRAAQPAPKSEITQNSPRLTKR